MSLLSPWLILFLPLLAAAVIACGAHRSKALSAGLSIAAVWTGFLITCTYVPDAFASGGDWAIRDAFTWMRAGTGPDALAFQYGALVDGLSLVMLLVVTGVGGLIHVYSLGYMHGDPGFARFFACLSLFVFSMLGIVLADNFFQIFIHWELVGVSSYLLISFYYRKDSAAAAGNKAFLTNRVGDFGFLIGILMLFSATGTADFAELGRAINAEGFLDQPAVAIAGWTLTNEAFLWIAGALVFMGVMGKSAQFPLHVWLPDAMEGPTPVSALIHAATMVAAGVFLLARVFFLYLPSETAMAIVAHVGMFTAFFAATIALVQCDIKRVLAFSTLSQLGYMVMAIGLGGSDVAMYHLATHAFFKACLFLGAGSVIHAVHSNDMREMGGLWRSMPITFWTFLVSTLALCGLPPLSGFWSKDGILHLSHEAEGFGLLVHWLPTITAVLTSFYMMRLVFMTFLGEARHHGHAHESPPTMTAPLVVLAGLAVLAGPVLFTPRVIETFRTITRPPGMPPFHHIDFAHSWLTAVVIFALGAIPAWMAYGRRRLVDPERVRAAAAPLHRFLENRWYVDDLFQWIVDHVQQNVARLCDLFDRVVIIGLLVNGSSWTARATGAVVARVQTGSVRAYVLFFLAGVAALLALNL